MSTTGDDDDGETPIDMVSASPRGIEVGLGSSRLALLLGPLLLLAEAAAAVVLFIAHGATPVIVTGGWPAPPVLFIPA